jgi:hypothetical protein
MSAAGWAKSRAALARAKRHLAALPESSTGHGAAVPFPVADRKKYRAGHDNKTVNAAIAKAPVERVPLAGLHAIQHSVKPERVLQYLEDPHQAALGQKHPRAGTPTDYPIVVQQGGERYVHDGHHRATAQWLLGKRTVEARLVDLDKK